MAELAKYQQDFLSRYASYANLASQQLGLPSRVILAKLAVETGWGQHFANNNLPGLKTGNADQNDGFGSAQAKTWEDYGGGGRTNIKDGFIKFPTPEQSIGGLVPWLSNSTYMNSLADRQGGGIFDYDAGAEAAAVSALGSSGFSTDSAASGKVNTVLGQMPNLSSYGIAPSFDPSIARLMNYVPYNGATGQANVSEGLGGFTDNNYNSGTEFQKQGELLSREKGTGIQLPSPTIGGTGKTPGLLDQFSDGITAGLEGAGKAVKDTAGQIGGATSDLFTPPPGPAPGPYDFANGSMGGSSANGSFGFGITPNGALPATPTPTLAPPPGTSTINSMYEAILRRPGDAAGLQAFDAQLDSGKMDLNQIQGMLRGSEEAKTLGPLGEARTYSPLETVFARQLDRAPDAQAIQNWGTAQNIDPVEAFVYGSPEAQTYRASLGDTASLIRNPSTAPTIGPGGTAGTIGPGATTAPLGPFGFSGTFSPSEYLKANSDVAASGMDALTHYATYGYNEGRNVDTAGHRVNQGFDAKAYLAGNQDVAKAGLNPLEHYVQYGAAEGRGLPTGSTGPYQFSGANVAQGAGQTGNGSLSSGFDGAAYLKQNRDVADAGMNPMDHYLRYGFAEGRAINGGGTKVNEGFDPSAYLAQNKDVAAAHLDPLEHYARYGVSEGRAAPTGSNPYNFSNFNVAQGAGPVGAGSFGLGGVTGGGTGGGSAQSGSSIPSFGFGQNVSQNVGAGSFGAGITPSPSPSISPFGFSGANVSGGLGATAQGLGGSYAVGSAADLGFGSSGGGGGSGGDGTIDPYGFGGDVSGFDVNNLGGSAVQESAGASGFGDGVAIQGRNNQASQNAFIAGEFKKAADSTAAARQLGEQITNVAPGNQTNYALGAINPTPTPQIQHTQFTPVNMSGVFAPPPTIAFMPRFTG